MVIKMKKNFRTVKASLVMGILLISMSVVMLPVTPADDDGTIVGLSSVVNLNWKNETGEPEPIQPKQDLRPYTLVVSYTVTKGGLFGGGLIYSLYAGRTVDIKLELVGYPEWATVELTKNTVTAHVPDSFGDETEYNVRIELSLSENAPAYEQGVIYIKATVPQIGPIDGMEQTFSLSFKPAYLALISPVPQTNNKIIGPMDTAEFPIDISNLGNARTKVFFEIDYDSLPDGWSAIINDNIVLETGSESTGRVYLTVRPPKGFGYHDDDAIIRVKITPKYADDTSIQGESEYLTVSVESRGLSIIGIEIVLAIVLLIVLVIIVLYLIFVKKMIFRK